MSKWGSTVRSRREQGQRQPGPSVDLMSLKPLADSEFIADHDDVARSESTMCCRPKAKPCGDQRSFATIEIVLDDEWSDDIPFLK